MNWDHVQFFLAVVKLGSSNAAAEVLRVSQSTVWRKINELEKTLGVKLFEADRKGYTITAAGLQLIPMAEEISYMMASIPKAVHDDVELMGSVSIAVPEIIVPLLTTEAIVPLHNAHPGITASLFTASPLAALAARQTDLSILWTKSNKENYRLLAEYSSPFAVYGTQKYLDAAQGGDNYNIKLKDHVLIDFEENGEHIAPSAWFKKSAKMKRSFRSNSPYARLAVVLSGMGVALFPCCFVVNEPRLVKVIDEKEVGTLGVYLYLDKQKERLPHIIESSKYLKEGLDRALEGNKNE
ncbi:LysR family transcriptional regulator [Spartinivicinus ruber]|uniref:LysR family transcriptional regulator n=1 Tax=Spartinivicinus ruber TaxID=2683272 RepID=UPI0013D7E18A|nr:LysR family transcriptional regulator [Spartinivicinus ruber]